MSAFETSITLELFTSILSYCPLGSIGRLTSVCKTFHNFSRNQSLWQTCFTAHYDEPIANTWFDVEDDEYWRKWVVFVSGLREISKYTLAAHEHEEYTYERRLAIIRTLDAKFGDQISVHATMPLTDLLYVDGDRNNTAVQKQLKDGRFSLIILTKLSNLDIATTEDGLGLLELLSLMSWSNTTTCNLLSLYGIEHYIDRVMFATYRAHGDNHYLRRFGGNVLSHIHLVNDYQITNPPRRLTFPRFRCLKDIDTEAWMKRMSGNWRGRFFYFEKVEGKKYNEEDMLVELKFELPNRIIGSGVDLTGPFTLNGTIDIAASKIDLVKAVPSGKEWNFTGCIDKYGFGGYWGVPSDWGEWGGSWKLWADGCDEEEMTKKREEKVQHYLREIELGNRPLAYEIAANVAEMSDGEQGLVWAVRYRMALEQPYVPEEDFAFIRKYLATGRGLDPDSPEVDDYVRSVPQPIVVEIRSTLSKGEDESDDDYNKRTLYSAVLQYLVEHFSAQVVQEHPEARDDARRVAVLDRYKMESLALVGKWRRLLHLATPGTVLASPKEYSKMLESYAAALIEPPVQKKSEPSVSVPTKARRRRGRNTFELGMALKVGAAAALSALIATGVAYLAFRRLQPPNHRN